MHEQLMGFPRQDGRWGIRNRLLVIYTVECASFVAHKVVEELHDIDAECVGFPGCTDNAYAIHLLVSLVRHPNVGAILAIGLGCEYIQARELAGKAQEEGKTSAWLCIQEHGGTSKSIEDGVAFGRFLLATIKKEKREPMPIGALAIGAECGGSDWTSGLAGNAVVGHLFDHLVDAGASAVFEEIVEAVGLRSFLVARGAAEEVREVIGKTYDKAMDYCKSVRQYSISPGNFAGGLTTIEEKSMGALVKSGSRPIQGVLKVGEDIPHPGLWLLDSTPDPNPVQYGITNPNDSEGLEDLISTGCQLVILITGRGSVIGSAVAPTLKITGNDKTFHALEEDMDFNAGRVLAGTISMERMTEDLAKAIIATVNGIQTKSERLGHKEYYIPYKYQNPTLLPCGKA